MNVVQISFFVDPAGRTPQQLLRDWWSLVDVADAAAAAGAHVTVLQASTQAEVIRLGAVTYRFLTPTSGTRSMVADGAFADTLQQLRPDVCHVHGLGFPEQVLRLAVLAPHTPILLQDHANRVPRLWLRRKWRRALAAVAGISFCAAAQARPFREAGLISPVTPVFEIPESTSRFQPAEQRAARAATGIYGDPAVLWVGHLNANKDPLTVLAAVRAVIAETRNLHLWCCYGSAPLEAAVMRALESDATLRERVHLLGRVPHERVEQLMQAADLYVSGSHREGSGYSLIEAMACGLPAAVTDIPSFRMLLGHEDIGALWRCGEPDACARALLSLERRRGPLLRARVRQAFDARLSLDALGAQLLDTYEQLMRTRKYTRVGIVP